MQNLGRIIITALVWLVCAAVSITTVMWGRGELSGDAVMMTILPLAFALLMTAVIWIGPELPRIFWGDKAQDALGKPKRSRNTLPSEQGKLALLMELMDEDEREAFKAALQRRYRQ